MGKRQHLKLKWRKTRIKAKGAVTPLLLLRKIEFIEVIIDRIHQIQLILFFSSVSVSNSTFSISLLKLKLIPIPKQRPV